MRSILTKVMVLGLFVTIAGMTAFAKVRKSNVSLAADTKINGMLVKKGMYDVVFNEDLKELSIIKAGKVIVKTQAKVEKRDHKARRNELYTIMDGKDQKLVGIWFGGTNEHVMVAETAMQASGN